MKHAPSKPELARLYEKRSKRYDFTANLYYLIGFREFAYRMLAVEALRLKTGDTVVEIGCGTGLNFPLLQERVGAEGRLIGVDLTAAMLERAHRRSRRNGWKNVSLRNEDAAAFQFPAGINAVISTFALTLVPEFDTVIEHAAAALAPGGRFAVLDFKKPRKLPLLLTKLGVLITKPFGVTLDMAERHPWESINRRFPVARFHELYFGFAYLSVGEKRS